MKNTLKKFTSCILIAVLIVSAFIPALSPLSMKAAAAAKCMPGFPLDYARIEKAGKYEISAMGTYEKAAGTHLT